MMIQASIGMKWNGIFKAGTQVDKLLNKNARTLAFHLFQGKAGFLQARTCYQWCRRRGAGGASAPPKVSICHKSGQKFWKNGQNHWKFGQKWRPMLFIFHKLAPSVWRKTREDLFWRSYLKKVFMVFAGENL